MTSNHIDFYNKLENTLGKLLTQFEHNKSPLERLGLELIFRETYKKLNNTIKEYKILNDMKPDKDLNLLIAEENLRLKDQFGQIYNKLRDSLLADKVDEEFTLEIRQGVGGEESSLFARELLDMYLNYCNQKKIEHFIEKRSDSTAFSSSSNDGTRETIIKIRDKPSSLIFKFEAGIHRVQRIPKTDSQNRIHTSTISIAYIPKIINSFQLNNKDLRIDTFRSSGPGGQHVNKTDSAVRIVHIPTGMSVSNQDERNQHQNREKALKILKQRLNEKFTNDLKNQNHIKRSTQIGNADRSEKIRTYNYPQDRIVDHRLTFSMFGIEKYFNKFKFDDFYELHEKQIILSELDDILSPFLIS